MEIELNFFRKFLMTKRKAEIDRLRSGRKHECWLSCCLSVAAIAAIIGQKASALFNPDSADYL
jgi:hypothetical protein